MEGRIPSSVNVRVLLVDDERVSRILIGNTLKRCGYTVTAVEGGKQALRLLQENPGAFGLVLSDVMMPGVDGIQLLKAIRASRELDAIPVVMVSANDNESTVYECISNGAEDYLLKPVTQKEVQYMWQHAWRRGSQSQHPAVGNIEGCEAPGGVQNAAQIEGVMHSVPPSYEGLPTPPADSNVSQRCIAGPSSELGRSAATVETKSGMEGCYQWKKLLGGSSGPPPAPRITTSSDTGDSDEGEMGIGQEALSPGDRTRRSASEPAASGGNVTEHDGRGISGVVKENVFAWRSAQYDLCGEQPLGAVNVPSNPAWMPGVAGQMPHSRWFSAAADGCKLQQPAWPGGQGAYIMQPGLTPVLPPMLTDGQLGPSELRTRSSSDSRPSMRAGSLRAASGDVRGQALGSHQMGGAYSWMHGAWLDLSKAEEARSELRQQHSVAGGLRQPSGGRVRRGPPVAAAERSWSLADELQKQQDVEQQQLQQQLAGPSMTRFTQIRTPSASAPSSLGRLQILENKKRAQLAVNDHQLLLERSQQWRGLRGQEGGEELQRRELFSTEEGCAGSERVQKGRGKTRSRDTSERAGLNAGMPMQRVDWAGNCQQHTPWGQKAHHHGVAGVAGSSLYPQQCVGAQQDWAVANQLPARRDCGQVGGERSWGLTRRAGEGFFPVAHQEQVRLNVGGEHGGGNPPGMRRSASLENFRSSRVHNPPFYGYSQMPENFGRMRTNLGAGTVQGVEGLRGRPRSSLGIRLAEQRVSVEEGKRDAGKTSSDGYPEQSAPGDLPPARQISTVREWLSSPGRVVNRVGCLHFVYQVVRLLNELHTQGLCVQHLRPSCIALSEDGIVSFLEPDDVVGREKLRDGKSLEGSDSEDQNQEEDMGMSRLAVGESSARTQVARFRGREESGVGNAREGVEATEPSLCAEGRTAGGEEAMQEDKEEQHPMGCSYRGSAEERDVGSDASYLREQPWYVAADDTGTGRQKEASFELAEDSGGGGVCMEEMQLMEDTERQWYASPEELIGAPASTATDMYSLGVLFFELIYPWSKLDEREHIMADVRHRILPPTFLSESPKEAAFCLWLLHPEPSSRPAAKEALGHELMNEAQMAVAVREEMRAKASEESEVDLLYDFLSRLQDVRGAAAAKLEEDIRKLTSDIQEVERRQLAMQGPGASSNPVHPAPSAGPLQALSDHRGGQPRGSLRGGGSRKRSLYDSYQEGGMAGGVVGATGLFAGDAGEAAQCHWSAEDRTEESLQRQRRRERIHSNFDHLEAAYFTMRWKRGRKEGGEMGGADGAAGSGGDGAADVGARGGGSGDLPRPLGCFYDSLCKFVRYSRFEVRATLRHGDLLNTSNMVCSLSFDKDDQFFATAGVCKRVKIFECDAVLNDSADIHYPVCEMASRSKLSCVCWNSYIKSHIASSDYEGHVQLWDASTGQPVVEYEEHEKRAWSVDFSRLDPKHLASGSDDGTVKLWSISQESSAATIRTKANVCCVQFSPGSAHTLAFGSADYKLYTYDLRHVRVPLAVFGGHGRAVSYVKFVDSNTLVSASTDNTLKLWDLQKGIDDRSAGIAVSTDGCINTFTGHTNEKNFVGLAVADGYMACGSETNSVFAYHRTLPMPIASHRFGATDPVTGVETDDDVGQFVSSVCWRGNTQTLVAANSMGNIKVLEMV